jgi:leader peptidase (prepilin peptidase) / N-methyltransferase
VENLPLLALASILLLAVPLTVTDFREHRLPNRLTYLAIGISAATVLAAGLSAGLWFDLALALGLGLVTAGLGYLMAMVNGIGMGDVKLLVATNIVLGWFSPWLILVMLAIGFSLASLVSLALVVMRRVNLKTPIAMGPFLLFGFALVSFDLFEPVVTAVAWS